MVINILKDERFLLRHHFSVDNDPPTYIGLVVNFGLDVLESLRAFKHKNHRDLNSAPDLTKLYPTVVTRIRAKMMISFALIWYI